MKKPRHKTRRTASDGTDPLRNWGALNAALMELEEPAVAKLLEREKRGRNRLAFTLRIHARLNRLRRDRERHNLVAR